MGERRDLQQLEGLFQRGGVVGFDGRGLKAEGSACGQKLRPDVPLLKKKIAATGT